MAAKTTTTPSKKGTLSPEEQQKIVSGFQTLRDEQTQLVQKTQDLEVDLKEHDLVLSTLTTINDKTRRCYRMIGGVLIEHTVGEVIPALETNREQIHNVIESFKQKTEEKGKELASYKQKYDIHFSYEKSNQQQGGAKGGNVESGTTAKRDQQDSGVLVGKEN